MLMLFRWLHGSWQAEGELHLSSLRCIYCTTDLVASQYASRFLGLMTVSPIILLSAARNINIVIFHGYVGLSEGSCWVWCMFLKLFGGCWMLLLWLWWILLWLFDDVSLYVSWSLILDYHLISFVCLWGCVIPYSKIKLPVGPTGAQKCFSLNLSRLYCRSTGWWLQRP
jgi:hypothetical protein